MNERLNDRTKETTIERILCMGIETMNEWIKHYQVIKDTVTFNSHDFFPLMSSSGFMFANANFTWVLCGV
jgi:hypothetical protein